MLRSAIVDRRGDLRPVDLEQVGIGGRGHAMRSFAKGSRASGLPAQMVSAADAKAKALVERDCGRVGALGLQVEQPAAAAGSLDFDGGEHAARTARAARGRKRRHALHGGEFAVGHREARADHRAALAAGDERARRRQAGENGRCDCPAVVAEAGQVDGHPLGRGVVGQSRRRSGMAAPASTSFTIVTWSWLRW